MAKGIASDKYEIGEVVMNNDGGKSMTEIELKQFRLSTPGEDQYERGQDITKSNNEFEVREESKKGDSGEFFQIEKSDQKPSIDNS